jgi:ketosteroid isomerase-like protein
MSTVPFTSATMNLSPWTQSAYACVDGLDAHGFSQHFADDIWLRFGNQPPVTGRDNAHKAFSQFFQRLRGLTHEMLQEWRVETPGSIALLLESKVTYVTDNGGTCVVPAATSWRLRVEPDGVERAYWVQIYVDLAPLFALLNPSAAN